MDIPAVGMLLFTLFGHFVCQSSHVSQLQHYADAVGPTSLKTGQPPAAPSTLAAAVASANGAAAAASGSNSHSVLAKSPKAQSSKGPGWGIIVGFTLAFVTTYPLHMYVAEVYLMDNFTFLLIKYCVGFLFVLFVPLITVALQGEIRSGIRSVFGSAVLCLQDIADGELGMEQEMQGEGTNGDASAQQVINTVSGGGNVK